MTQKAYSVPEFCRAYRISRSTLYALWRNGRGPASYLIGRKRMITASSAAVWHEQVELAAAKRTAPWSRGGAPCSTPA